MFQFEEEEDDEVETDEEDSDRDDIEASTRRVSLSDDYILFFL